MLDHISKHVEILQKYSVTRCIYNSLGVWECGQTGSFVFDLHVLLSTVVSVSCNQVLIFFRLQVSPDYSHFATASDDGSVKLWDLQKLDGRSLINKSRQTYSRPGNASVVLQLSVWTCACSEREKNSLRLAQKKQETFWGNQEHFVVKYENDGLREHLRWYEISGMALQVDNFCKPVTEPTPAKFA